MNEVYAIPGFAEPVNCWTHLGAAGVFLYLWIFLLRRGGTGVGVFVSLFVFGFSCVLLLSMSGVYHLLAEGGAGRLVLHRLDHAAIFMFIAATFTPVHMILFSGIWRWGMISVVWSAAMTGITLKTIFFSAVPELLGLSLYLALGWLGVVSGIALWRKYGFSFIKPLLYGGFAYTVGALLEFSRQPVLIQGVVGPHELFHVAVLFGISFHWWFICQSLEKKGDALL